MAGLRGRSRADAGVARACALLGTALVLTSCEALIGADFSRSLAPTDEAERDGADAGVDAVAEEGGRARDGSNAARVVELAAGGRFTCARLSDGRVKCWGYNLFGQLGLGDRDNRGDHPGEMGAALPAVDLGPGRTALALAAGQNHVCARLDDGSVKCWGRNRSGALGLGDTNDRGDDPGEMGTALGAVNLGPGRTASSIAAGEEHTCAILDDQSVKCWGDNTFGGLGLGHKDALGDAPNEMGAALPTIDFGPGRRALSIAAGDGHTCAVLDDQSVKCWGANDQGQLGLGDTNDRGDAAGEMGSALPTVALGTGRSAVEIAAAGKKTCARLDDGRIKCWGLNTSGALGLGHARNTHGGSAGEMGDGLPNVDLGVGQRASAVAAGWSHACARLEQGRLKCWGWNGEGRLGLGDIRQRGDTPDDMGDALPFVDLGTGRSAIAVAAGSAHSCALLDDASVKCWGWNALGQLGQGDTARLGDGPGEMGSNLPAVPLE